MAAGEAGRRAAAIGPGARVLIRGKRGEPKWHPAWEGNPYIARPGEPHQDVMSQHELRPYIEDKSDERWTWREYSPIPAHIELSARAQEIARHVYGAVVFNPSIKRGASPNKDWGLNQWKTLVARNPEIRWVQIGDVGVRIRGAEPVATGDFIAACGALAGAAAVVVHEGALHHAAAALQKRAIVIRGGYISPRVTGYAHQDDLYVAHPDYPLGCGYRVHCAHCEAAMVAITPKSVEGRLWAILNERPDPPRRGFVERVA